MSQNKKKIRAAVVALPFVAAAAMATSAFAQDTSWYVGGQGSAVFQDDADATGGVGFSNAYETGYGVGGFLGHEFGNGFRTEAELGYQHSKIDNGSGHNSALFGLASGYYDFNMGQNNNWKPYFGGGVGYADIRMNGTPGAAASVDDSDQVPIWALSAGLGYTLNERTTLFTGYRYMATIAKPSLTNAAGQSFDLDYSTHNVQAGVRYAF